MNHSIPLKLLAILRFSNEIDYLKLHLTLLKNTQFEVVCGISLAAPSDSILIYYPVLPLI